MPKWRHKWRHTVAPHHIANGATLAPHNLAFNRDENVFNRDVNILNLDWGYDGQFPIATMISSIAIEIYINPSDNASMRSLGSGSGPSRRPDYYQG